MTNQELPVYLTGPVTNTPEISEQARTAQFLLQPDGANTPPIPIHCTGTITNWVASNQITAGTPLIIRGSIQKGNRGYYVLPDTIGKAHKGM